MGPPLLVTHRYAAAMTATRSRTRTVEQMQKHHEPSRPPLRDLVTAAEVAVENDRGGTPTIAAARRHILVRVARGGAGFVLIGAGIALLPLPGPGTLLIIVGLGLLPFRWSRRLVAAIRERIPGAGEDGAIPPTVLAAYIAAAAAAGIATIVFGGVATAWLTETFGDPNRLLG